MVDPTLRLLELDARHTELLERLSMLDRQVKEILSGWSQTNDKNETMGKYSEQLGNG
ncbi:MAG: hypothetical protein LBL39_07180 [Planctomycetaceae bacterium]|jgi:hypothetical protein|nr:hypothetical protein [Planctomycetaceae bacterium]